MEELLKHALNYLWAAFLIPLAIIWRRADNAVSKEDLKEYANTVTKVISDHAAKDEQTRVEQRETMLQIFEKLDKQADILSRVDQTLTIIRSKR